MTISNASLLAQRFAFVRLPSYLSVRVIPSDVVDEEAEEERRRLHFEAEEARPGGPGPVFHGVSGVVGPDASVARRDTFA